MSYQIVNERDHVYFNAIITPDPNNIEGSPATFKANFTSPLLVNPQDFYASVIRFAVPINTIPILKFPLNKLQNNPAISKLIMGISYSGTKYPVPVSYIADSNIAAPTPAVSSPYFTALQASSDYYNVYSIRRLLHMFNVTLAAAITASGCGGTAVYTYSAPNQLISLTVNNTFVASGATIFMNDACFNFLNSFPTYYNRNALRTVQDDYYHILTDLPPLVGSTYTFEQDYNAMSLWPDLKSIIIESSLLPIASENVPSNDGVLSQRAILTDYIVGLDDISLVSTVAIYNPTSQWRMIDMVSNVDIMAMSLSFYYADKAGNQYPLLIDPSQSASIKLAFVRKSIYKPGKV